MLKMATGITVQQHGEYYIGMLTQIPPPRYPRLSHHLGASAAKDTRSYANQGARSMAQQKAQTLDVNDDYYSLDPCGDP